MSTQGIDPRAALAEMLGQVFDANDRLFAGVAAMVLPRRRQRFGRIDLEREPDAQRAGGKADHDGDDEHDRDALGIQHQPSRESRA